VNEVIDQNNKALSIAEFKTQLANGALVLDCRDAAVFGKAFIPGAINIGVNGSFATWVGTLIKIDSTLVLIAPEGKEKECVTRLARVGFENVNGYLNGGMVAWMEAHEPIDHIPTYTNNEYEQYWSDPQYALLDVRNSHEAAHERLRGAVHIPLNVLQSEIEQLNMNMRWMVYCAGGYRSMIAASILKAHGFKQVFNVEGGIAKVKQVAPQWVEMV
jgi:rhodanese-related sulfurtransferase